MKVHSYMVSPKSGMRTALGVSRQQWITFIHILELLQLAFFIQYAFSDVSYIFHQHGAFVAGPVSVPQGWYQASRVDLKKPIRLLIRINLNVLVIHVLGFK